MIIRKGVRELIFQRSKWIFEKILHIPVGDSPLERIVEYPFVLKNLPKEKCKILDVGCRGSFLIGEMAALGHEVHGIDNRVWKVENFTLGDIREAQFHDSTFDIVVAVSTIEHIGISKHDKTRDLGGDKKAIMEMTRILRPDGKMLVTVPIGRKKIEGQNRFYCEKSIMELFSGLKVDTAEYYARKNGFWVPIAEKEAMEIGSGFGVNAVGLFTLSKSKGGDYLLIGVRGE